MGSPFINSNKFRIVTISSIKKATDIRLLGTYIIMSYVKNLIKLPAA